MDLAHLHLILNHLPIVGFPILLIFILWAHFRKDTALRKFSYVIAVGLAFATFGAFQTGEPAEDRAEAVGAVKSVIHEHEEAAETSMILVWVTAALAFVAFFTVGKPTIESITSLLFIASLVLTIAALSWTGYEGGKIRHSDAIATTITPQSQEHDD